MPSQVVRLAAEPSDLGHLVLDALATAATKAAIGVLEPLTLDAKRPREERRRGAAALARATRPSAEQVEALRRCTLDPALDEFGLMGLGTAARRARDARDTGLADRADALLRAELGKGTPRRQADTLLGIANSGSGALYAVVLPYQDAPDASVREAAIQAVRLMPGPEPTTRLLTLLDREPTGDLRAALGALRHRSGVDAAAVRRVESLTEHESVDVRLDATRAIGAWAKASPRAQQALTTLAKKESDPKVVELARQLIQ